MLSVARLGREGVRPGVGAAIHAARHLPQWGADALVAAVDPKAYEGQAWPSSTSIAEAARGLSLTGATSVPSRRGDAPDLPDCSSHPSRPQRTPSAPCSRRPQGCAYQQLTHHNEDVLLPAPCVFL